MVFVSIVLIIKATILVIYRKLFQNILLTAGLLIYVTNFSYGLKYTIEGISFSI
jgi:hypothetical protein